MSRTRKNYNLPDWTIRQMSELIDHIMPNETAVIVLAVDDLHGRKFPEKHQLPDEP